MKNSEEQNMDKKIPEKESQKEDKKELSNEEFHQG